jgi:hypothetical protein
MTLGRPEPLTAEALIELSGEASRLSPGKWALALLRAAYPSAAEGDVLDLTVGSRDRAILAARRQFAGDMIAAEPVCESCGKVFELSFSQADVGLAGPPDADPGFRAVEVEGRALQLRPVTVADLLAVEHIVDTHAATARLAALVTGQDEADAMPVEVIGEALEEIDPAADVWLATTCPECGHSQSIAFDPVHFTAAEIRHSAQRILQDVVDIARAFHWSERDILALPDDRRAWYVAAATG